MKNYNLMSKMIILLLAVLSLIGCGTLSSSSTPTPSICPQDGEWITSGGIAEFSFTVSNCEIAGGWMLMIPGEVFFGDPSITIPIEDGRFSFDENKSGNFSVNGTFSSTTQAQVSLTTSQGTTIDWNASPVVK